MHDPIPMTHLVWRFYNNSCFTSNDANKQTWLQTNILKSYKDSRERYIS